MSELRKPIDHLNAKTIQKALFVLCAPILMMLGCGSVNGGGVANDFGGSDLRGRIIAVRFPGQDPVPYDEAKHGPIRNWLEPREGIIELGDSVEAGYMAIHDHDGEKIHGPHLYSVVKRK